MEKIIELLLTTKLKIWAAMMTIKIFLLICNILEFIIVSNVIALLMEILVIEEHIN